MRRRLPTAMVLLFATPAVAQTGGPRCEASDPITAEVNAREGIRLAKDEQFETAAALFQTAVRLDPCSAKYLYLLGRAQQRQDQLDEAEATYQGVAERFPTSIEATKAQGGLAEIHVERAKQREAALREAALAEAEAAARRAELEQAAIDANRAKQPPHLPRLDDGLRPEKPPEDRPPWMVLGFVSLGTGAACAVGGVLFALAAQDADEALVTASRQPDRARYDELVDDRSRNSTLSYVAYGLGGALMLGGAAMLLLPGEAPRVGVTPAPGGAALGWSGTF